jgi:hypothetical protein
MKGTELISTSVRQFIYSCIYNRLLKATHWKTDLPKYTCLQVQGKLSLERVAWRKSTHHWWLGTEGCRKIDTLREWAVSSQPPIHC